jgi:hypothetical protein
MPDIPHEKCQFNKSTPIYCKYHGFAKQLLLLFLIKTYRFSTRCTICFELVYRLPITIEIQSRFIFIGATGSAFFEIKQTHIICHC